MSFNLIPLQQEDAIKGLPSLTNFNNTLLLIQTIKNVPIYSVSCLDRCEEKETPEQEDSLGVEINNIGKMGIGRNQNRRKKNGCTCKKTNCLKRYCQCFSLGKICSVQCACFGCFNTLQYEQLIKKTKIEIKCKPSRKTNQGCICKKSQCQKKYCQCFNAGIACTQTCKCIDCQNHTNDGHSHGQESCGSQVQGQNGKGQENKEHTHQSSKIKSMLSFSYEDGIYGLEE